jgi:excinuclease ABC subunit A
VIEKKNIKSRVTTRKSKNKVAEIDLNNTTSDSNYLHPKTTLSIRKARVHNLKDISIDIPKNRLVVITGVSGSGKSSLAFNTIYAEGQRRYVESLSSYARQFLSRMTKPDVESITGLAPAVAIEQKTSIKNARSTVGTATEIYDYLRLLFARIGRTYCKNCNIEIVKDSPRTVQSYIQTLVQNSRFYILFPIDILSNLTIEQEFERLKAKGFFRIIKKGETQIIDLNEEENINISREDILVLVDRIVLDLEESTLTRIADGIEIAFREGDGIAIIDTLDKVLKRFSTRFECSNCGSLYKEPTIQMFSFNNAIGACKKCEGYGKSFGVDYDLVIPDKRKSISEDAIHPISMPSLSKYKNELLKMCRREEINIDEPFSWLTKGELDLVMNGTEDYIGVTPLMKKLDKDSSSNMQSRFMAAKYRGLTTCSNCEGSRLSEEANQVFINNYRISDVAQNTIENAIIWFNKLKISNTDLEISIRIIEEISKRLSYLNNVGIGYLTLDRLSHTLSGGESQRINLATSIGSALVGAMYVLDEPSIGLHPRDTHRLIDTLKKLRDIGNTVIVVEHDMGPKAGEKGGEIVSFGTPHEITNSGSLTGEYLNNNKKVGLHEKRKIENQLFISLENVNINNLKNVNVKFPLNQLVVITGVSGSGKSSLIHGALFPAIAYHMGLQGKMPNSVEVIYGYEKLKSVEMIDQTPIGRTSRSNPATYVGAFDVIRDIFSNTNFAKSNAWKSGYFSFNVPGGRCEVCQGEGTITVEMQFLADLKLQCESCKGKRFKSEVLKCELNGKNIVDVLNMTVSEALIFFKEFKRVVNRLKPLEDVGLGYVRLGQPATTLSGGEAQRVKIATQLADSSSSITTGMSSNNKTLFILDEPTTGLHFDDINTLMISFYSLLNAGHSVVIIEHNLEVIKNADWIIDIGPEAGDKGGEILFEGKPEDIVNCEKSYTGHYLELNSNKFKN